MYYAIPSVHYKIHATSVTLSAFLGPLPPPTADVICVWDCMLPNANPVRLYFPAKLYLHLEPPLPVQSGNGMRHWINLSDRILRLDHAR